MNFDSKKTDKNFSSLTPAEINLLLGKQIKQIRRFSRMTQEMLAECLGVTFQQVQKYEKGSSAIRVDTLLALCYHLSVHPGLFLLPIPFSHKKQTLSEQKIEMNQFQRLQTAFYSFKPELREHFVVLCEMIASLNFFEDLLILAKMKNLADSLKDTDGLTNKGYQNQAQVTALKQLIVKNIDMLQQSLTQPNDNPTPKDSKIKNSKKSKKSSRHQDLATEEPQEE